MPSDKLTVRRAVAGTAKVAKLIKAGHILVLAGAEQDLASLPAGNWIGGTASCFLVDGRLVRAEGTLIYADFSAAALKAELRPLNDRQIQELSSYYPDNGFAVIIMPGQSALLQATATSMPDWPGLYNAPLAGWVSAVPLDQLGHMQPKVFCGNGTPRQDIAALMYVTLPCEMFAALNIINPFDTPSRTSLRFSTGGYQIPGLCLLDGQRADLTRLIANGSIDPSPPLTADRDGALLNNSIIASDPASGMLTFLSPVDPSLTYRFAEPPPVFQDAFARAARGVDLPGAVLSSICAAGLHRLTEEIRPMLPAIAPVTFGQIGYTVLTQTIACLSLSRLGGEVQE
jgi:hypothetical protein